MNTTRQNTHATRGVSERWLGPCISQSRSRHHDDDSGPYYPDRSNILDALITSAQMCSTLSQLNDVIAVKRLSVDLFPTPKHGSSNTKQFSERHLVWNWCTVVSDSFAPPSSGPSPCCEGFMLKKKRTIGKEVGVWHLPRNWETFS